MIRRFFPPTKLPLYLEDIQMVDCNQDALLAIRGVRGGGVYRQQNEILMQSLD